MLLRFQCSGLMSVALFAQTASLTGRVTDPSGAVVPHARVAVRSVGTGVQFRAEVFNSTNTARFAPPNAAFGSTQFGQVNSQRNQPRIVQFSLKLSQ